MLAVFEINIIRTTYHGRLAIQMAARGPTRSCEEKETNINMIMPKVDSRERVSIVSLVLTPPQIMFPLTFLVINSHMSTRTPACGDESPD